MQSWWYVNFKILIIYLASSSVSQKSKYSAPKKQKGSSKDTTKVAKRVSSKGRNTSTTKNKRPPLKPNLKSSKQVVRNDKNQAKGTQEQKRGSINTNPFKPPRPGSKAEPKVSQNKKIEEVKTDLK